MPEYAVRHAPSGWAVGFNAFAGTMMIVIGFFHAAVGLAAMFSSEFYAVTTNYLFEFDVTSWGWIHMIAGVVVLLAGFGVFSGAVWARSIGVVLAGLSAVANFMFLPYYPLWSMLIIAVDVGVIYALTTHGGEMAEEA